MRSVFVYALGLFLSLWLGGLISLFLFVSYLFKTDRATAVLAAPAMFHVFDRYQLILAGLAIVSAIGWRLYVCSNVKRMLLASLLVAAVLISIQAGYTAPRVNAARGVDLVAFNFYHKLSTWTYQAAALFVLAAGACFVRALLSERNTQYLPRPTPSQPPVTSTT